MTAEQAALLSEFNFVIAIDASGSMGETDMPGNRSRWDYMQESLTAFARDMATIDSDGLDLVVFGGSNIQTFTGVDAAKVKDVFTQGSPRGSTPLAEALTASLTVVGKSDKKAVVVVFTDGVPDDRQAAARAKTRIFEPLKSSDFAPVLRPGALNHTKHGSLQTDGSVKPYRAPIHGCVGSLKETALALTPVNIAKHKKQHHAH